ncbi:PEP-CTERM sorting domain-containing protein [Psychromonas sp.]|uniref:PEP-CTERM sorting domain-containing protein n=1 Tax=Psychromonas sp. TaxID=1884585 RepID=UPI0039E425D9
MTNLKEQLILKGTSMIHFLSQLKNRIVVLPLTACAIALSPIQAVSAPITDLNGVDVTGCLYFFSTCNSSNNDFLSDTAVIGSGTEFDTGNRNVVWPWWMTADFDQNTLTVEYFATSTSMASTNLWFELDLATIGQKLDSVTLRSGDLLPVNNYNFLDDKISIFVDSQSINNQTRLAVFDITTVAVPAPTGLLIFSLGLLAIALRRRT